MTHNTEKLTRHHCGARLEHVRSTNRILLYTKSPLVKVNLSYYLIYRNLSTLNCWHAYYLESDTYSNIKGIPDSKRRQEFSGDFPPSAGWILHSQPVIRTWRYVNKIFIRNQCSYQQMEMHKDVHYPTITYDSLNLILELNPLIHGLFYSLRTWEKMKKK